MFVNVIVLLRLFKVVFFDYVANCRSKQKQQYKYKQFDLQVSIMPQINLWPHDTEARF